ncbi:precorrin-6A/cobalt-precorrin-6A reductase, partial [Halomonas aquamarina]
DEPTRPLPLAHHTAVIERGPFTLEGDLALFKRHRVTRLVCKNAGGDGARAKLDAAHQLGVPVVMIERPPLPARREVHGVDDVLAWLDHATDRGV